MENSIVKSVNSGLTKIWQVSLLFILFIVSFVNSAVAQNDEPSTGNLKNNLAAGAKELQKQKHDEIMSYVYMAFWFAVVIFIAWSTTVMARKRNKRQLDEKQRYILKQQELRKHHPHGAHGHSSVKARR